MNKLFLICTLILIFSNLIAQDTIITLPKPKLDETKSLVFALENRKSTREFLDSTISPQIISNLLWAANGINRQEDTMRTAPSVMNWQEVELVIVKSDGAYIYQPETNSLKLLNKNDVRADMGLHKFFSNASIVLIYVGNYEKMGSMDEEYKEYFSNIDAAFVSQNAYLYCASENLATVIIGTIDKVKIQEKLKLPDTYKVIMSQPIGYFINPTE